MKKKKVLSRLEKHHKKNSYSRIVRGNNGFQRVSTGFILGKSADFILLQEVDDFRLESYQIIPIETIKHVRHNKNDQVYEQILKQEYGVNMVESKYVIDLSNWSSICKDIQKTKLAVISECEHFKQDYFCIGDLRKVNKKSISIRYFNAQGILDKKNTKHKFKHITKLSFDDHYANVFSKYIVE